VFNDGLLGSEEHPANVEHGGCGLATRDRVNHASRIPHAAYFCGSDLKLSRQDCEQK
jgi:hypothetical protein